MTARIRKTRSRKTIIALTSLIIPVLALAAAREPVSISGTVDLETFTGVATVTIDGDTLSGSVAVVPLAEPVPADGGLYFPVVEHWFVFDGDNLVTTGKEFIMQTDEDPTVFTLHGDMEIVPQSSHPEGPSTAGRFNGMSGALRVNGMFNNPPGMASFEAHGVIAR